MTIRESAITGAALLLGLLLGNQDSLDHSVGFAVAVGVDRSHDLDDVDEVVAFVSSFANSNRVLELGVGTGRLAIPLAEAGLDVVGVDNNVGFVTRILDEGGEIAGKAVCEYYCVSGGSHTSATGPVHNPRKRGHTTGGSSSGSAARSRSRSGESRSEASRSGSNRSRAQARRPARSRTR